MSYRAYIEGYSSSAIGGRVASPGFLSRVLRRVFRTRTALVAQALGLQDGMQERVLRSRSEVLLEIERLLE